MRYFRSGDVIPCGVAHLGSISPISSVEVFYGGDECFVASFECDAKHFNIYAHQNGVRAVRVDIGDGDFCIRYERDHMIELWLIPTDETYYRSETMETPHKNRTVLMVGDDISREYEVVQIWNDKWDVKVLFARRLVLFGL